MSADDREQKPEHEAVKDLGDTVSPSDLEGAHPFEEPSPPKVGDAAGDEAHTGAGEKRPQD